MESKGTVVDETIISVGDVKYVIKHTNGENLRAERHGGRWRDLAGDGLVLAMAQEIEGLKESIRLLEEATEVGTL